MDRRTFTKALVASPLVPSLLTTSAEAFVEPEPFETEARYVLIGPQSLKPFETDFNLQPKHLFIHRTGLTPDDHRLLIRKSPSPKGKGHCWIFELVFGTQKGLQHYVFRWTPDDDTFDYDALADSTPQNTCALYVRDRMNIQRFDGNERSFMVRTITEQERMALMVDLLHPSSGLKGSFNDFDQE